MDNPPRDAECTYLAEKKSNSLKHMWHCFYLEFSLGHFKEERLVRAWK